MRKKRKRKITTPPDTTPDSRPRGVLRAIFFPAYSELSLFLIWLTFILVTRTDSVFRSEAKGFLLFELFHTKDHREIVYVVMLVTVLLLGCLLSAYHVFSSRPKSSFEKKFMIFFSGAANGFAGISAGLHITKTSNTGMTIFPLLNIIYGVWQKFKNRSVPYIRLHSEAKL